MLTIEPILLDVDVSVEEYELEYSEEAALEVDLATAIIVTNVEGEHYQGAYIVTPKKDEQTILVTKDKVMDDNVTVLEIPYQAVSNLVGGKTAIIGGI